MAAKRIEAELDALGRLRSGSSAEVLAGIRKGLGDKSNVVIAKAAKLAGELGVQDVIAELIVTFGRLFDDAVKRDPQCWGKNAIAKALRDMEYREGSPFLRGARWVQMEPVWGGQADTAGPLRGICLLALPGCGDVRRETIMRFLVDALVESDPAVRADAARAVGSMGGDDSALVLRLKARTGDEVPAVTGQVFESLLSVERSEGLEFVRGFLRAEGDEAAEEAALAIGASRMEKGVEVLLQAWSEARGEEYRGAILRALAISRRDEALTFLRDLAADGRERDRVAAKSALEIWNSAATRG